MKFLLRRLTLLLFLFLFFFPFSLVVPAQDIPGNPPNPPPPIRIACVGDSITQGFGTSSSFNAYPMQLQRMLGDGYKVGNFGNSGKTLLKNGDDSYWKTGSLRDALGFKADIVTIMLGTNDTKPQNWKFKDQFVADYKDLVAKFKALDPKPKIFLVRPTFIPGSGRQINEVALLEQLPMIDSVASDEGLPEIDVHGATKDKDALFPDNVHPNNE